MRMRFNYWTCSKFADWIRGTMKPMATDGDGWKTWKHEAKRKHPIRYWIAEEGLDLLQMIVYWPADIMYSAKYYVVNRWIDQSHALVAHYKHIPRGQWLDLGGRMLYCLFDELVDFVEIEIAYKNYRWNEEKQKGMRWWQVGRWRTRTWRSREAGLDYLKWEMTLTDEEWLDNDKKHEAKPTSQALAAKEIMDLYTWWTEVYPNRPDPYDVSGWSAYCDSKRERGIWFMETDPLENKEETYKILSDNSAIEAAYEKEEEEMLIRLIKIRNNLWT
jgi:hypothetical protein